MCDFGDNGNLLEMEEQREESEKEKVSEEKRVQLESVAEKRRISIRLGSL